MFRPMMTKHDSKVILAHLVTYFLIVSSPIGLHFATQAITDNSTVILGFLVLITGAVTTTILSFVCIMGLALILPEIFIVSLKELIRPVIVWLICLGITVSVFHQTIELARFITR